MKTSLYIFQIRPLATIAILAVATAILPLSAVAGPNCTLHPNHPSCGGVVDPGIVYTVALTEGVFRFPAREVTLNSKGNLKSADSGALVIGRPADTDTVEQDAWDAVTANCGGGLAGTFQFLTVNFDDWAVGKNGDAGNVWISLENIRLPDNLLPVKEIQIQLQKREGLGTEFLPAKGQSLTFSLDYHVVWGKPLIGKGKKAWDTCYQSGNDSGLVFPDGSLVITRPQ